MSHTEQPDVNAGEPGGPRLAPVIVFAYLRADHLRRSISSLQANAEARDTDLTVFCDAPRRPEQRAQVQAVRDYVDSLTGFRSITRVYRTHNLGLARSVIDGVSQTLATHQQVIVLEDDLVVSPFFLRYMNDGLQRYRDDPRVASIHGYSYPTPERLPQTFFLTGADCWGWATWSRAWAHFEPDGAKLLRELRARRLTSQFDFDNRFPYVQMLEDQIAGRNSSWAIRWHAAAFLQGLLTLYPGRSLVHNIGNDSSGTHCGTTDTMGSDTSQAPVPVPAIAVEPCEPARQAFGRFLARQRPWRHRLGTSLRRWVRVAV
jgi:hypothetical protein